ncbi:MAG: nicotinate-nucleotide pyrophosphorylase [Mucilaginibacter sp.]|nr:nicotinate-nucleotide pyrophosphorylase [Mucilaginibacter sp.]
MTKNTSYRSVFAPYFDSFLKMKEQLGFRPNKFQEVLYELDQFFVATNAAELYITREQIIAWDKTHVNQKARTLYDKHSITRQFCRYLSHLGHECYIHRLPRHNNWPQFIPYIFSHEQMESIFKNADKLRLQNRCMTSTLVAIPAIIRLLYSTGMRIGEARYLKNEDVDLVRQNILLKQTKNKIERLIPINDSLFEVLNQYRIYRDKMPIKGINAPIAPFFVSTIGASLGKTTIGKWFTEILEQCEIPRRADGQGPRIHDIRHTTAVHSLMNMVKNGLDIYCAMPILSVFLGHKTLSATEGYVRLTQEVYPDIVAMERPVSAHVFPNNPYNEVDYGNH